MSTQTATLTWTLSWCDADGRPCKVTSAAIACPYKIPLTGIMPVPAGTAGGVEVDVGFPGIVGAATVIVIENATGQELQAAFGGNYMPTLAAGACQIYAHPQAVASRPVTSLRFWTTQAQAADGAINYWAFGA